MFTWALYWCSILWIILRTTVFCFRKIPMPLVTAVGKRLWMKVTVALSTSFLISLLMQWLIWSLIILMILWVSSLAETTTFICLPWDKLIWLPKPLLEATFSFVKDALAFGLELWLVDVILPFLFILLLLVFVVLVLNIIPDLGMVVLVSQYLVVASWVGGPDVVIWKVFEAELVVDTSLKGSACVLISTVFISCPFSGTGLTFSIILFLVRTFTGETRNPMASWGKLKKRRSRAGLLIGRRKSDRIVSGLFPFVSG